MTASYRFAICNEIFGNTPFEQICKTVRNLGYEGLEIAPFTLAEDAGSISDEKRAELRKAMGDEGLEFVGLHWLTASPPGLHMTTRDEPTRTRTWQYFH